MISIYDFNTPGPGGLEEPGGKSGKRLIIKIWTTGGRKKIWHNFALNMYDFHIRFYRGSAEMSLKLYFLLENQGGANPSGSKMEKGHNFPLFRCPI